MRRDAERLLSWMPLLLRPPTLALRVDPTTTFGRAWRDLVDDLERTPTLAAIPDLCRRNRRVLRSVDSAMDELDAGPDRTAPAREWLQEMDRLLAAAESDAANLCQELHDVAGDAGSMADAMDFRFLYDGSRELLRIGYDAGAGRPDPNHYDLLASEARLASFLAIARGDVRQLHWFHLGRPLVRMGRHSALCSWGGTLFEYLMPSLVLRDGEGSLLARSARAAVNRNIAYGVRHGVPWGVSESGFYRFDPARNYQYRAFGVPGLGLRRGLGDDLVVAPYASLLAVGTHGRAVMENLRHLESLGALGEHGFFEAIDFTPERLPEGAEHAVVRSYMAHHQGMILVAITNRLLGDPMPRRFQSEAIVQTAQILLHEVPPPGRAPETDGLHETPSPPPPPRPRVALESWPAERGRLPAITALSNGRLTAFCTDGGGGGLAWQGLAITRFEADATRDDQGLWIYVRDEESGELLSVSRRPAGGSTGESRATFHPAVVEYQRRAAGLFVRTEVAVVARDDVELRRVTIANESAGPRRLAVASFGEVVLAAPGDAARHPAFERLFVRSELDAGLPGLLFERRPRAPDARRAALMHRLVLEEERAAFAGFETDRGRFLGRGGAVDRPAALAAPAAEGATGFTLDPILSLRAVVTLAPGERTTLAFVTAVASTARDARDIAARYRSLEGVDWAMNDADAEAAREVERVGIDPRALPSAARVLAALTYSDPALRAPAAALSANRLGRERLYGFGISGDLPILLVRAAEPERGGALEHCLRIHRFWHGRGVLFDLVVLSTRGTSYAEDAGLEHLLAAVDANAFRRRRGGVFVVRADQVQDEERALLEATARLIVDDGGPPLERALAPEPWPLHDLPDFAPAGATEARRSLALPRPDDLRFDNGIGGFRADGRAYAIHLEPGEHTPAPWCNVLAHGSFGALVSESGIGAVWSGNAAEGRLVPWRNDPVGDEPAAALWLRDEETGVVWSPTPQPTPGAGPYQVEHAAGRTRWRHGGESLEQELEVFVPPDEDVLVVRLGLRNALPTSRRITATFYAELVLGARRSETAAHVVPEFDAGSGALLASCAWSPERAGRVAFLASTHRVHGFSADRLRFLGADGGLARPRALARWGLSDVAEPGGDPCFVLQVHVDMPAGGEREVAFFLGDAGSREDALRRVAAYRADGWIAEAERSAEERWDAVLDRIEVHTPEPALDLLLNRWLPYQVLSSRVLGRTGFYQSSGAYGFRDQLQDVAALAFLDPETARAHILRAAAHQFEQGDVLHWWHPPDARGVRTRCSDDLAWLPFVLAHHVRATGDAALLSERVPFLRADALSGRERERYGRYGRGEDGTLLEHARRAMERAWTTGEHGLPLIGTCDWNDGFDRVGDRGRGESVWLAWFLIAAARAFAELCERAGVGAEAEVWRRRAAETAAAAEKHAWDGAWYLRAFDDEGRALGADGPGPCRIDSIAQSWAVLCGAADPARARAALESADRHLVRRDDRLVLLFTPPFGDGPEDPGYVRAYPPGVRENGGQYTHAAAWLAWAFAELGDGARAEELLRLIAPVLAADTPEGARRYRVEPYVLAGDVASEPPHTGRGGWTWYTGSAAWVWRLGVERILGLVPEEGGLRLDPRIPPAWEGFEAVVRLDGHACRIRVENPERTGGAVRSVEVDGKEVEGAFLPRSVLETAGEVRVVLGSTSPRLLKHR
jgi:cyclic beta-1,2-glucan synthetase